MSKLTGQEITGSPVHTHDCERCTFLGSIDGPVDLYFCPQIPGVPTVIARYGSLGHQYTSGLEAAGVSSWLGEAKRRAQATGLLP